MKKLVGSFLFATLLIASGAFAQARYARPTETATGHLSVRELVDATRITPLVASGSAEPIFIFPIVGSTPGAGGLFFRSETTIVNLRSIAQNVELLYLPSGGTDNCNSATIRTFRMNASTWYVWTDFVRDEFNASGLGSVVIVGLNSSNTLDANAQLDGFTRIWTPIPGGGTASQSFPAESFNAVVGSQVGWGMHHDANFRTNVGVFNYDFVTRIFDVAILGLNGSGFTTLTVPPCSMALSVLPAGNYGVLELSILPRDTRPLWYGFGSSIDNVSGDNWSVVLRH